MKPPLTELEAYDSEALVPRVFGCRTNSPLGPFAEGLMLVASGVSVPVPDEAKLDALAADMGVNRA